MIINPEIKDVLFNGTRDERLYLFDNNPMLFAVYYFPEYFYYKVADFQVDFFNDCKSLTTGELNEAMWKAFRESAKTSIAKVALVCWEICFKKKHYINVDAYDKGNAEAFLFDVAVALQTNRNLISDFGQLYYKGTKGKDDDGSRLKRISNFITENDIKVEAFSTQESTRGRVYKNRRPDQYIIDDFETSKTADSPAITGKIISHIDELKAGLASTASILYLCNYITDDGVVAHVEKGIKNNPRGVVRDVPVIQGGRPTWPDKYVMTDEEAVAANMEIEDPKLMKISLESRRRDLGDRVFNREMMNDPGRSDDYFFDRDIIKRLMDKCIEPKKTAGGLKIWIEYNPNHRHSVGVDTAEGNGGDANADVVINLSRKPALVAATFQSNQVSPNVYGKYVYDHAMLYGECLIVPEINVTGYATVARLLELNYSNMYLREVKNQTSGQIKKEYGFKTTVGTRMDVLSNLRSAVEDGELEIWDLDLLKECYSFKLQDAGRIRNQEGVTRHFDKLIACALAWEGRRYATPSAKEGRNMFKSPQTGEYQV